MTQPISELAIPGLAPPEPTVSPDNPGNPKGNKWIDVVVKPEYISLSNDDKAKAKEQYFNEMVAPHVPSELLENTRTEFSNYTKRIEIKRDEPTFLGSIVDGLYHGTKRTLGVTLGVFNSPLAFVWGSQNAQNIDPEEFNKMPAWKQTLTSAGEGLKSAYRSTVKENDWGTTYNDYFKGVTGKTIEENLPDNLKWTAPTIEFLANLITDPLIGMGTASSIAKLRLSPGAKAMQKIKFPERVLAELEKFDQLQAAEKSELQKRLVDILKNRNEYHKWWENTVKENPAMVKEPMAVGSPLMKPGERAIPDLTGARGSMVGRPIAEDIATKVPRPEPPLGLKHEPPAPDLPKTGDVSAVDFTNKVRQGERLAPIESKAPIVANHWSRSKIETAFDMDRLGETTAGNNPQAVESARLGVWFTESKTPIAEGLKEANPAELRIKNPLVLKNDTVPAVDVMGDKIQDAKQWLMDEVERAGGGKKLQEELKSKGYDGIILEDSEFGNKNSYIVFGNEQIKFKQAPTTPVAKQAQREIPKSNSALEFTNRIREASGMPPLVSPSKMGGLKSPMGMAAGIEQDDEGNIRYNIGKGILGTLAVAGGLGVANIGGSKKFQATLSNYPAWKAVHDTIGETGGGLPEFGAIMSKFGQKAVTVLFDRFSILAKKGVDSAYNAARTYNAYKDQAALKLGDLAEKFKPVKKDEIVVRDYILANRDVTRLERGIPSGKGVTLKTAQQAVKDLETYYASTGKDPQLLKNALNDWQKWTHDNILKEALDSGVISKEAYADIVKNNKWYAAFDVLDHLPDKMERIPGNISGEYFSVANQKIIKEMKGTEKQIADPIEATLRKFANGQSLFARNRVANALVDDPVFANVSHPVAKSKKEFEIMTNKGLSPVVEGTKIKGYDTISRFKDGRVETYLAPTDFTEAMKQLSPRQAGRAVHAVGAVFRNAATSLYLPFTVSNAFRDGLMAYTTAPVYKALGPQQFFADWGKGFWEGAKQEFGPGSQFAKDYINAGGGFGYVGSLREAKIAKEALFSKSGLNIAKDVITSPFKLIEKISTTIELAPRLGTFRRGLMQGLSPEDAALVARQSTIDFNRGGTFTKVANQFVPFLNARVQSRVTLWDALKNKPGATISKALVSTVIPGMGAYAWNRMYYSDLLDDIPEEIRKNYFCIITGTGKDSNGKIAPKYFVIPKGDLGQMVFNPIEFAMDKMWKKDRTTTGRFLINTLNDLSPIDVARDGNLSFSSAIGSVLPPIVKAPIENITNLNFFTGREVVPYYMGKNLPPELQYKKDTPELYKYMGEKMGVSPLKIQNMASGVLAAYGREGLSPDAMLRGLTGRIMKTRGGAIEERAWETIKDIENGYVTAKAYSKKAVEEGDRVTALKIIREWNAGLSKQIDEYNKDFGETNFREKGGIRKSYMFTPEKIKSILMNQKDLREPIQQKLMRK